MEQNSVENELLASVDGIQSEKWTKNEVKLLDGHTVNTVVMLLMPMNFTTNNTKSTPEAVQYKRTHSLFTVQ